MRPKAAAIWPISSRLLTSTCWSRSPSAMPSAATRTWRTPRMMPRTTKNAMAEAASRAKASSAMTRRLADAAAASLSCAMPSTTFCSAVTSASLASSAVSTLPSTASSMIGGDRAARLDGVQHRHAGALDLHHDRGLAAAQGGELRRDGGAR